MQLSYETIKTASIPNKQIRLSDVRSTSYTGTWTIDDGHLTTDAINPNNTSSIADASTFREKK